VDADLLLHSRWIVPVEPEGAVLQQHALVVRDGVIVDLCPSEAAERRWRAAEVHRLDRHVLIPGLINAHTHAAMTLFRGLADDLPLRDWLERHIWPAERRWASPEFVRDGVRLACAEMLRGGVTCFNDMYFFPDTVAAVATEAGMRAAVGLIVIDFPTPWAKDAHEYLSKGLAVHDALRSYPLIRTVLAPHAPYTVSDPTLRRVSVLAEELDLPIHMHLHETAHEVAEAMDRTGRRPLEHLAALGLLSPRLLAVHMTQLSPDEIEQIARFGVHVIHCPRSNLKLASGLCPVESLYRAGINVALGTDGAASNNSLDMFDEMRTAALLAKAVAADPCAVPAPRALRMATLNGAQALGIDAITGSLRPGKQADVVAVDLGALETQPVYDPLSQLVFATSREAVTDVWVAGRALLRDRKLQTLEPAAIVKAAQAWGARIVGCDVPEVSAAASTIVNG
jgi:5-methylthioadenosine/S-adenosylhomocysteine deaminase